MPLPHITAVAGSPTGKLFAVGSQSDVHVLDATDGRILAKWKVGVGAVRKISWTPDGKTIVFSDFKNVYTLNWQTQVSKILKASNGNSGHGAVTLNSKADLAIEKNYQGSAKIWGIRRNVQLNARDDKLWDGSFDPANPDRLAFLYVPDRIRVYDVTSTGLKEDFAIKATPNKGPRAEKNKMFLDLGWSSDGSQIVAGGFGYRTTVWDSKTHQVAALMPEDSINPWDCKFVPSHRCVAVSVSDGMHFYNSSTGAKLGQLVEPLPSVRDFDFSHDGNMLAADVHDHLQIYRLDWASK